METSSLEGLFPLAADEMLRHLLREPMAAGCVLQTVRLREGTFAWLQSFAEEALQGVVELGPLTSKRHQPSLEQNCTSKFYVLTPNANHEPDVCFWISLSHAGFVPCDGLCSVALSNLTSQTGVEHCGQENAGPQLRGCAKRKASSGCLRRRTRKGVAQGEYFVLFLEQNRLPSLVSFLSFTFSDNLRV